MHTRSGQADTGENIFAASVDKDTGCRVCTASQAPIVAKHSVSAVTMNIHPPLLAAILIPDDFPKAALQETNPPPEELVSPLEFPPRSS